MEIIRHINGEVVQKQELSTMQVEDPCFSLAVNRVLSRQKNDALQVRDPTKGEGMA